ncbi:uncharacterized protein LOC113012659 [Astatotilapia calliptera]|uniref:uncharacterized protein LOC113012659 n=1 Tax=Astatotilapia calliptera TaxID=8154 RepID=UPI000E421843|nr:uncharacterized protein LOC113012659 [Astatotilapia calliptera]
MESSTPGGQVQQKFLIPENGALKVTDEQGTEVDEDVFPELAAVKEVCSVIYTAEDILETQSSKKLRDCSDLTHYVTLTPCDLTVLKQHVEEPSSPSLTDTLSVSTTSSQSSDTSDAGLQMVQPLLDSIHERNVNETISKKILVLEREKTLHAPPEDLLLICCECGVLVQCEHEEESPGGGVLCVNHLHVFSPHCPRDPWRPQIPFLHLYIVALGVKKIN